MFLKLTKLNGNHVYINFDNMECFGTITKDSYKDMPESLIGYTYVIPVGIKDDEECYVVKESPQEIEDKLFGKVR